MPKRDNYKAKWLAALADGQQTPSELADVVENKLDSIEGSEFKATRELSLLHQTLIEGGKQAVSLCDMMDECRDMNMIMFKEITHGIDSKISQMPSKVLARRMRDVLMLAEERIGYLSTMCENLQDSVTKMSNKVDVLEVCNRKLQMTTISDLIIGGRPTKSQMEDFFENQSDVQRHSEYNQLPDDFSSIVTNVHSRNIQDSSIQYDDNESNTGDVSSDDDSIKESSQMVTANRPHKRNDSHLNDVEL
jgi:hypothetical protein